MSDFDAIRDLARLYFEGLYTGNVETLEKIFHAKSALHTIVDGALVEIQFGPYMTIVKGRASPQSLGAERNDRLIAIQQSTPTTALLIVSLLLAGKSYTDHLSLLKVEGRWQIMSKVYHLNP